MAPIFYPLLASFCITFFCIVLLKPVAPKLQLVDLPGGRKQHDLPTPVIGGIAMLLGLFGGLLLLPMSLQPFRGLIFGCALLVFVGVLDDIHELSPRGRLAAQLCAIGIMIFASRVQLHALGNLLGWGPIVLPFWFAIPLTLFGAASLINAINMLDGQDGLCASVVLIALTSLMLVAYLSGYSHPALILALIAATIAAYLCFNFPLPGRPQAHCFMGDAGSMLLGFILAWFTISLSQQDNTLARPAHMLWIAAIPLLDLATVFIKRIANKRSPFEAGREHIHHVLQDRGYSRRATLIIILSAMLLANLAAWLMIYYKTPDPLVFGSFIALFIGYLRHHKD